MWEEIQSQGGSESFCTKFSELYKMLDLDTATATYDVKKIVIACSLMIGHLLNTTIVVSTDKEW